MNIKKIIKNYKENQNKEVSAKAWVVFNRGNKNIRFLTINDGTVFENVQVVCKKDVIDLEGVDLAKNGSAVFIKGKIIVTPDAKQAFEIHATEFELLAKTDSSFPLQKQGIAKETLREIPHVRHRTNLLRAVMRIRSTLMTEIHQYFSKNDFLLINSPIITSVDGEGAGESFTLSDTPKIFDCKATLGVTGQLHAESYAIGFKNVYSFNPIFRAENSHTQKHAAEF
jgi:asparaginyl-tRNA synthetase